MACCLGGEAERFIVTRQHWLTHGTILSNYCFGGGDFLDGAFLGGAFTLGGTLLALGGALFDLGGGALTLGLGESPMKAKGGGGGFLGGWGVFFTGGLTLTKDATPPPSVDPSELDGGGWMTQMEGISITQGWKKMAGNPLR